MDDSWKWCCQSEYKLDFWRLRAGQDRFYSETWCGDPLIGMLEIMLEWQFDGKLAHANLGTSLECLNGSDDRLPLKSPVFVYFSLIISEILLRRICETSMKYVILMWFHARWHAISLILHIHAMQSRNKEKNRSKDGVMNHVYFKVRQCVEW